MFGRPAAERASNVDPLRDFLLSRAPADPDPVSPVPPGARPDRPQPAHERPLTQLPSEQPTGSFARFLVVAGVILAAMLIAVGAVFALIYWKAQHR